jgi:hypothetical protein
VQSTLDRSIDPIAWTSWADLGGTQPYVRTNTDAQVGEWGRVRERERERERERKRVSEW